MSDRLKQGASGVRKIAKPVWPRLRMKARRAANDDRREELLRPSRHLGYDRDALASFLMTRGAYRSAESL